MPKTKDPLQQAAVIITKAKPSTPSGVLTVIRALLPFAPIAFQEILNTDKGGKAKPALREIRATLDAMDLD